MWLRNRLPLKWLLLVSGVVLVRLAASSPSFIESYYAPSVYPFISGLQRTLFGWLPFSVGDFLYILFGLFLIRQMFLLVKGRGEGGRAGIASNLIQISILIYLIFNVLWGLNYNRKDPAARLGLATVDSISVPQLDTLAAILLEQTNRYRPRKMISYEEVRPIALGLFQPGRPVALQGASMKPSLFGVLGNYMGYSGYYNPFSGEAQVNTRVPDFLIPFVTCHEIAHQAGYAKENEANFIGFLAGRASTDSSMRYSTYFSMFLYANGQLKRLDSAKARGYYDQMSKEVKADVLTYRTYLNKYDTPVGDFVDAFYDRFLRLNQQPAGSATYSKVILWLAAYYRKNGEL